MDLHVGCLHDLVIPSKTGLRRGRGLWESIPRLPKATSQPGCLCSPGHVLWCFSNHSVCKVKVVKGEKNPKQTHPQKRKKVAFCTSENPLYSSLKLEPLKHGFDSGEALEALQSHGEPSFQSSSGLSLGFVLLKELVKCPGLKNDAMKNLDLSFQRAVRDVLSPYELLLSQLRKIRFDFRD